ncbi:neutral zinc metallopeptidase [Anaerococcus sp. mt242]|uniref:KPN_02809 family neutral zinc metallopeptidase n=1 Tax=Anaerococcus sp. mt242 TaxID=2661917 RepID=UPI0019344954|nr:neutral zinc metallopeptidase [Anaerococcus sp. mt242]MBM0046469.1 zinc metallopeptidase [Anaerococcus sp. mt242]
MKWEDRRRSSNVRRGPSMNRGGFGGGGSRGPVFLPMGRGRGGLGGIIFFFILMALMRGLLGIGSNLGEEQTRNEPDQYQQQTQIEPRTNSQSNGRERLEDFLSVVLADTEDVWNAKFEEMNATYTEPTMVPFTGSTRSACGVAQSNMGPFYCPLDESIYIDADFYNQLVNQFGAEGDFALAYVLAHEVGHHVQNQLGILEQTNKLRQTLSTKEYNKYSVAQELQADYFGGLFAYYVQEKGYLEPGDIDEAMNAAAAIGDDKIQEMSGRNVNVDTFTHGSSAQRKEAFDLGYQNHDIEHSMVFFDRIQ